jgi:RimJ/RimL family protein N-acetyltransferase
VTVVADHVELRRFEARDLPAFAAYRSDPEIAAFQSWETPYTRADAERFLAEQQAVELGDRGAWAQLAIADRAGGALLGDCAVRFLVEQPRTAEIGITLARGSQGRGVAREALSALLGELFGGRDLHRVIARTDDRNAPAHRLLAALGFREEGRLVEADWFKGEWASLRLHALLAREWRDRGSVR